MRLFSHFSIYSRFLLLSAVLTVCSVLFGFYITHKLTQDDRDKMMGSPAQTFYQLVVQTSAKTNLSLDESFALVDQAHARFPFERVLMNQNEVAPRAGEVFQERNLANGKKIVFYRDRKHPHGKPGPFRRGTFMVGMITTICSIVAGLGFSMIFIGLYLRRKSREAEKIISNLKSGDLKARFDITKTDEASQLMINFNQMADAIEGLVENLRTTEKARKTLLQELAHDLRTPVASLKNLQETLIDKGHLLPPEKTRHVQELALHEVIYFERLVEDLLFLSGVNDPKYDQNFNSVDLSGLIKQELEIVESETLKVSFATDSDGVVKGNEHLLRRLLKNILSNSARFAKGHIDITLTEGEAELILSIKDDGPGMDQDVLDSFGEKKFSRKMQHDHHKDHISIGLGSVIIKKIVDLHEGKMNVKNHHSPHGCEINMSFIKV